MPDKPRHTNRLIHEKSLYLQQHAHNPVDWYAWGEEAFAAARKMDRPIFLSIGYATCHWCHMMEKESFEDEEIARLMNEAFINVKVDREELPEVDSLYMEFAQMMMAGAAGWPLNLLLTPDLKPFFAATYLPPESRQEMMGITDMIERMQRMWHSEERTQVLEQSEKTVQIFKESIHVQGDVIPAREQVEDSAELLFRLADPVYGGMKGSPKFPIGYQLSFMMRYSRRHQDSRALFFAEKTLRQMHQGGIYDHLGGGFSRYSVDERWQVPHFEKMLYDNAILAQSYLEAWQVTRNPAYERICREILDFVLRELTHAEGGFFSAIDSDSEGHEGWYYTWLYDEILELLGKKAGALFCEYYGATKVGNFEWERNILHPVDTIEAFAQAHGIDPAEFEEKLEGWRKVLREKREQRERPLTDDKVLSSWNGLMIHALAFAGHSFNEPRYLDAATRAGRFIKMNLWKDDVLYRRWREGEAQFPSGLDEYAFMIRGLLSLFEAGCGTEWLLFALQLNKVLYRKCKAKDGAFYQTSGEDPNIILRKCQFADGAEPSGNAIQCENLLRLYQWTHFADYLRDAEAILKATKKYLDSYPPGYTYHLMNLIRYYDVAAPIIVIALNEHREHEEELRKTVGERFIPDGAFLWRGEEDEELMRIVPMLREQGPIKGKTTLYICHEGRCEPPITDFTQILKTIRGL